VLDEVNDLAANRLMRRAVAVVLGCDEVASAIAHRLHRAGYGVVLIDRVDPSVSRRGMSFADAWYYGIAELSGIHAVFCASLRSIPSALHDGSSIAATTWS
jgi:xanthine dehydrogenase accessory factor